MCSETDQIVIDAERSEQREQVSADTEARCWRAHTRRPLIPPHRAPACAIAAARIGAAGAVWVLVTKGWNETTLQTPSEVATSALGNVPVVALAGPALAADIFTDSPSGLLCASHDRDARRCVAAALASPTTAVFTTSDVAGAETAAAFKNVVAVAVGLAEGLSDRLGESALIASFGNARAAVFARAACSTCWLSPRHRAAGRRRCSDWPAQETSTSPASTGATVASDGCSAPGPRSTGRSARSGAPWKA